MIILILCVFLHTCKCENLSSAPNQAQMESATKLAKCRANCIDAFSSRFVNDDSQMELCTTKERCLKQTDCWMCWDYCQILHTNFDQWKRTCDQKALCLEGCRLACTIMTPNPDTWEIYHHELWAFPSIPTLTVNTTSGWLRLHWPHVVPLTSIMPPLPYIVYVVFWHPTPNRSWLQLDQILTNSFDTRHGDIVISGSDAEFLLLAVTRDGLVASTRINGQWGTTSVTMETSTTVVPVRLNSDRKKLRFILAVVGVSLLTSILLSIGLYTLYRMINLERRRRYPLIRQNAIRIRLESRRRSESGRLALITDPKPKVIITENRYPSPAGRPQRDRFSSLFKGTIFESSSNDFPMNSLKGDYFQFDDICSFNV